MDRSGAIDVVSDGCTGFQWAQWFWPEIERCCRLHDAGGSDGALLDCLFANLPEWAWAPAAFCVALMVLFRPIYERCKRK